MSVGDILIIVSIILAVAVCVIFYVGKKNYAKNIEAQSFINQYKMVTPILVIDKRYEKPSEQNLPKNIYDNLAVKKTVKVELAGIYISNIVGLNLEDKKNKTWREKLSVWVKKTQDKAGNTLNK